MVYFSSATVVYFCSALDIGFISRRYERGSLVVTTNLPFARWSEVFLDATAAAAVIDRIVHHATVLLLPQPFGLTTPDR